MPQKVFRDFCPDHPDQTNISAGFQPSSGLGLPRTALTIPRVAWTTYPSPSSPSGQSVDSRGRPSQGHANHASAPTVHPSSMTVRLSLVPPILMRHDTAPAPVGCMRGKKFSRSP